MIFTEATIDGLTHPYVFDGVGQQVAMADPFSPFYGFPFVLSYDPPGADIFIADAALEAPYFVTIAPGAEYGLGLIRFTSDPLVPPGDLTPLSDTTGGSLPLAEAVPEPSSMVMMALAAAMGLVGGMRRRSSQVHQAGRSEINS